MNNIFVTGNASDFVEQAEFNGYPRNICSWIKGMYSVALTSEIEAVVGVVEGDCSNTHSLMSTLIDKNIEQARLYISGLGYYEATINSERVGDHLLDPGWTNYSKRILYSTYDVSDLVREGGNTNY